MIPSDFVRAQLSSLPNLRSGPTGSFILCPFHQEKSPSGRVNHDASSPWSGSFKCFGCGKTARWNELARALGLQPFGKGGYSESQEVNKFQSEYYEKALFSEDKLLGSDYSEYTLTNVNAKKVGLKSNRWRGYNIDFLREEIGASLMFYPISKRVFLKLPVTVNGDLKGYVRAALEKPTDKKFPSYLNKPGNWAKTHGLFPFDPAIALMKRVGLETMVIVEGQRDALRLLREDIPAVSMLGTQSWSNQKSRLLEFAGVKNLCLLLDGDKAGRNETRFLTSGKIKRSDEKLQITPVGQFFDLSVIKLWEYEIPDDHQEDKLDPGNMPKRMLTILKKEIYGK